MRMKIDRHRIAIIPESPQDEAYIEKALGLQKQGDWAKATRIDAVGLPCLAYVTVEKKEDKQ